MRVSRRVLCVSVVAALSTVSQPGTFAQLPASLPTLRVQATSVEDLRTWDAYVTQHERAGSLRVRTSRQDPDLPSRTVERLDQFHEGIPIWGADIVRSSERGVPIAIFGVLAPDLSIGVEPSLAPDAAGQALVRAGGIEATLVRAPELIVLPLESGDYRLAYMAVVASGFEVNRIFVDAQTGVELWRYSEIQRQSAVGVGRGVLNDNKKLSVRQQSGGFFIADDSHRPPLIATFDMRGNRSRATSILNGQTSLANSDFASDADNVWTDPPVVDAHAHVALTYDFYYKRFGRNGLDGRNKPIQIMTNAVSQQGALSLSASDLYGYAINAFWCPACYNANGMLYFGNGIPPGYRALNDRNYTYFSGALDIAAHEFTHAVTSSTSNLMYANESGALNEAFSDMMGKSVEFYFHPAGAQVGQADYVIGKDIARGVVPGALNGDRSMANPALYGDPDHWRNYRRLPNTQAGDYGGIHSNSGIPNHAFYLAIEGGTNRTSGMVVQGVGASNRERIEKVFYRAFTIYLTSTSNFSQARTATIQAARDLYGAGGVPEQAVTQAWSAVGVTDTSSFVPQVTRLTTVSDTLPGDEGAYWYYWNVTMPTTGRYQAVLNWADPSIDLDLAIGPVGCFDWSCMSSSARNRTTRPETVCHNVSAGQVYSVLTRNWSNRSAPITIVHTIDPSPSGPCALPGPSALTTADGSSQMSGGSVRAAYELKASQ